MIGKRLGDRYELESRIGSGGMAVVYLAKDLVLDRNVAVKILNESLSNDDNFVDRFRREARAAASLSHPNVVGIYDVGQDNGTHYIVMEYIEGKTLKERIRDEGALPVAEVVAIGEQIADALDHAHEKGIVHRDIKSHNIMIGTRGRVKVADFGIARATSSQTITHTGSVMGSVHYFSPEQARGGYIGEKSDIYSLGVVLYEMATGELPFSGESPIAIALKHLQEKPEDPIKKRYDLPQSVDNLIRRAMAKDPLHRYPTAGELQAALSTALHAERLNEPRWEPEDLDGEETMVIPAIRADDLTDEGSGKTSSVPFSDRAPSGQATFNEESNHEDVQANHPEAADPPASSHLSRLARKERQGRTPWWKKTGFIILTALLVIVLSAISLNTIWSLMSKDAIEVPDVTGMSIEQANASLRDHGLKSEVIEQAHDAEVGTVFKQSPEPSKRVKKGYTVKLYVSEGGDVVSVPNMINSPEDRAKQALYDLGFKPGDIEVKLLDDDNYTRGHVVKHEPVSGEQVAVGEKITLYVRPDDDLVEIPNVIGDYQSSAEDKLRALGFKVYRDGEDGAIYDPNADVPYSIVFDSTPSPGTMHPKGEVVRLHVSINKGSGDGSSSDSEEKDDRDKDHHEDDDETDEKKGSGKGKKKGKGKGESR